MKKSKRILLGILYWVVELTWGSLLTIPGLLVAWFVLMFVPNRRVHKNGFSFIIEVGGNWGGLELGAVALCGHYYIENNYWFNHTRCHEFGHSIQQLIFGPLQLFIVSIPSAVRYWYQRIRDSKGLPNKEYDNIWFEYTASKWGTNAINKIEGTDYVYDFVRSK